MCVMRRGSCSIQHVVHQYTLYTALTAFNQLRHHQSYILSVYFGVFGFHLISVAIIDTQKLRFANNTYYVENPRVMKVLREILTNILTVVDVDTLDTNSSSKKGSKTPRILKF